MANRIYLYGEELAADDIGDQKYQLIKLVAGAAGNEISDSNPMPVTIPAGSSVDPMLEISKGNILGQYPLNKFGRSTNVDNGVNTDIWDKTADQVIWIAPTQARAHNIASSSGNDDGTLPSNGARTIQIYGLPDWNTAEVSQIRILNGLDDVVTNSYVIIHRMKILTKGITNVNVGTITATAVTDGTVTAQILAGQGQTQMAIYGIPSTQTLYITSVNATMNRAGGTARLIDVTLLVNPEPESELLHFLVKHTFGLQTTGTTGLPILFRPYKAIPGPAIVKIQAVSTVDDTDVSAWFDGILVDN